MAIYLLKLSCGHKAVTDLLLKQQYKSDTHMILCPSCSQDPERNVYGRVPTAWNEIVSYREIPNGLLHVFKSIAFLLPRDIMRLQPAVPRNRVRPFPYVLKRGRVQ